MPASSNGQIVNHNRAPFRDKSRIMPGFWVALKSAISVYSVIGHYQARKVQAGAFGHY